MEALIPDNERSYLRELAKKQAEYAALPIMEERKQMWYDLNDAKPGARPPMIVETWTFDRDFMHSDVFKCESQPGRGIETQLLRNIRNHEIIDDDKVMPDSFDIGWFATIDELGVKIECDHAKDAEGVVLGYKLHHPIKDLKTDLEQLKPAQCRVNKKGTLEWKAFVEELLGDIMPVNIRSGPYGPTMLTHCVINLMGMEAFYMAMYDSPGEVHKLMSFLRDNSLRMMHWAESEGLLALNNNGQESFGSSFNWTTKLPAPGYEEGPARLCDMWGSSNSQETTGISPEMFHEFCFPYYKDVCEPLGLLYYGCCEPVHPFWNDLQQLPHLKKISISRWCDEKFMGDALRGTEIIYSRKPDPNFLSLDVKLDEDAWAKHIRETLEATKGVFTEFIVRDVYTLHGNLNNARRCVEIARKQIDKYYS